MPLCFLFVFALFKILFLFSLFKTVILFFIFFFDLIFISIYFLKDEKFNVTACYCFFKLNK